MKIFGKVPAKRAAKRRFDEDQGWLADEAEWNQQQSERILREVKQVGGWEAWEALEKQREQSILDDAPPLDENPLSLEEMLKDREPEPPEGEEPTLNQQEAERILREVKEVGGWDAWEALEKKCG